MANPSVAAHGTQTTSGTSSYTANITITNAGDYLVLHHLAFSSAGSPTVSSITDNATNHYTWTQLQGAFSGTTGGEVWLGTPPTTSPPSGALIVTVTMTATTNAATANLYEIAGSFKVGPVVRSSAIVTSASGTVTVATTPVNTGDLVMSFCSAGADHISANPSGGGWTLVDFPTVSGTQYGGCAYQTGKARTALSAAWTINTAVQAYGFSVVLKAANPAAMLAVLGP